MTAVTTKAEKATQFWGSAIVKVPMGGRKKKLKQSMLATEAASASTSPQRVAIASTASRNERATVTLLTLMRR